MIFQFGVNYININFYYSFKYVIKNYIYIVGIVGKVNETDNKYYIWTHKKFDIGYNGQHIVDVNLTSESKVELKINTNIEFSYEINWKPSTIMYKDRFNKYLDPKFFEHRVS